MHVLNKNNPLKWICYGLALVPMACASKAALDSKAHEIPLYLDLVYQVTTQNEYGQEVLHAGYPWEGGYMVGCGWISIKYSGFEIQNKQDIESPEDVEGRNTFEVQIPIGQSCDFSDYIASPSNPRILKVRVGQQILFVRGLNQRVINQRRSRGQTP